MQTTPTIQERLAALAEAAFFPLESHASFEEDGRYQIRILEGAEAIHIEEMPAVDVRDERDLSGWIGRMRGRLEEMGYELDPWEAPEGAR